MYKSHVQKKKQLYDKFDLVSFQNAYQKRTGRGFGGRTLYKNIAPHALEIGDLVMRNIIVSAELSSNLEHQPNFALLGQRVLRRYMLLLDYNENCAYLLKNRADANNPR